MMKKTFNLLLLAGALILGSCEKDVVTAYATVEDDSITVEFQAYGPDVDPGLEDPEGTVMADSGLESITISGGDFSGDSVTAGEEVQLYESISYLIYWTFYDTSSPSVQQARSGYLTLNFANRPSSITIYLGDDAGEIKQY